MAKKITIPVSGMHCAACAPTIEAALRRVPGVIEAEVDAELKAAIKVSEETPAPSLESLFTEVFAELPWHLKEQQAELLAGPRAKGH